MDNQVLWYRQPAKRYVDGMLLGNGRIGAVVKGGILSERINLNEETLWSGFPRTNAIYGAYDRYVRRIRKKILLEKDDYGAEDLADKLQGPYTESYITAGELALEFSHRKDVKNYRRGLDMRKGVAFVEYQSDGVTYRREHICSAPDDVIAFRFYANKAGALSLSIDLDSMVRHEKCVDEEYLILTGRAPRHVEPYYLEGDYGDPQAIVYDEEWEDTKGLRFCTMIRVLHGDGTLETKDGKLELSNASECVILLWLGTDFKRESRLPGANRNDYRDKEVDLPARGREFLARYSFTDYQGMLDRHEADMTAYFDRVALSFHYDKALDELPTDERRARYARGEEDAGLEKQAFDFGRYILYSCSREGTEAANLQGIWCWNLRPQWSCNYTVNINTQMNYWGANVLNMPECHLPLFTFLEELTATGAKTAGHLYGARGFCVHHNTDLWRACLPIGMGHTDSKWALFPTAGLWLSLHIMEHYRFTGDKAFLERYFHILKGACLFAVDMMCEMDGGYLGICPTTVPERRFYLPDGNAFTVGAGSTFDYQLLYQLFDDARRAVKELGAEETEFLAEIDSVEKRFPPMPVREDGMIADWQRPCRPQPYMWANVLFGLYPGNCLLDGKLISKEAMRHTLETRADPNGPFASIWLNSFANMWIAGAWARLGDAEKAYSRVRTHLNCAMVDSLLGINKNGGGDMFQTDANLGLINAFAEMILQSDERSITLLPALPKSWRNGEIRDFCTRCGARVAMKFENGVVTGLTLFGERESDFSVWVDGKEINVHLSKNQTKKIIENGDLL